MLELQSQLMNSTFGLTEIALETFCDDIASMFGMSIDYSVDSQEFEGQIGDLRKDFRKISVAFKVASEGALNGDIWVVLDNVGLFVLSGVFVMLPENVVQQKCKSGTLEDANAINDALGEVGNMLVGSWDRIYREQFPDHGHFLQTQTAINKDWSELLTLLDLPDEALGYQRYKVEIDPYSSLNMAVIYPSSLFAQTEAEVFEETAAPEVVEESLAAEEAPAAQAENEATNSSEEAAKVEEPESKEVSVEPESNDEAVSQEEVVEVAAEVEQEVEEVTDNEEPQQEEPVAPQDSPEAEPKGPVTQAIQELVMPELPVISPTDSLSGVVASQIANPNIVWATSEASVEELLALMQNSDTDYVLIGSGSGVEGIVSGADIRGAMSPYLQAMFAQWKRPQDLATLKIKAKWIMGCAVTTVRSDSSFDVIAKLLYEQNLNVLPVTDSAGKVCGVVTRDQVMRMFLGSIGVESGKPSRRAPVL